MSISVPLTGLALADELWAEGLAPDNTQRHERPGPLGSGDMHAYTYRRPATEFWCPWESFDAVAHLLERYEIEVCRSFRRWYAYRNSMDALIDEDATTFADLPAAIARLALRLHAAEQKEDSAMSRGTQGWSVPDRARKAHYFRQGTVTSLCRQWIAAAPRHDSEHDSSDNCAVCKHKHKRAKLTVREAPLL